MNLIHFQDSFLDVSLVLKPFGATTVVGSVEEALAKFIETEKLDVRICNEW